FTADYYLPQTGAAYTRERRRRARPARPTSPVPSSSSEEGSGTVAISPEDTPTVTVFEPETTWSRVNPPGIAVVVMSMASLEPGVKAPVNAALPELVSTVMLPKNLGLVVLSCKRLQCISPVRALPPESE